MNRIAFVALAFAVSSSSLAGLAGCVDNGQEDNVASLESDITSITPFAGGWTYDTLAPVSTNCSVPAGLVHGESGPFTLGSVTSTSFRVTPNDGTAPFACSYADGAFTCPRRASARVDLHPFLQAVVSVDISVLGFMSDSRHALGKQDAAVSCVGSGCSQLGQMPCGFVDDFSVHAP